MPVRSCRVTITDLEGIAHTVEVTAATLYEAVALGLAAIRGNEWVMGIGEGLNVVRVRVTNIPVDHEVKFGDFTKWLARRWFTAGNVRPQEDTRHSSNAKGTMTPFVPLTCKSPRLLDRFLQRNLPGFHPRRIVLLGNLYSVTQ